MYTCPGYSQNTWPMTSFRLGSLQRQQCRYLMVQTATLATATLENFVKAKGPNESCFDGKEMAICNCSAVILLVKVIESLEQHM